MLEFLEYARRGRNDWWRYPATFALAFALAFLVIAVVVFTNVEPKNFDALTSDPSHPVWRFGKQIVLGVCVLLIFLASALVVQRKKFTDLIGNWRWGQTIAGAGAGILLAVVATGVDYFVQPGGFRFTVGPQAETVLVLAVPVAVLYSFLTNIIFSGQLAQGLLLATKRPLVAAVVVGGIGMFTADTLAEAAGILVSTAAYALITIRTGGIAFAWGLEFASEFWGYVVRTSERAAHGDPGVFSQTTPNLAWFDVVVSCTLLLAVWLWVVRRYPVSTVAADAAPATGPSSEPAPHARSESLPTPRTGLKPSLWRLGADEMFASVQAFAPERELRPSIPSSLGAGFALSAQRPVSVIIWGVLAACWMTAASSIDFQSLTPPRIQNPAAQVHAAQAASHVKPDPHVAAAAEGLLAVIVVAVPLFAVLVCAAWRAIVRPAERSFAYLRLGPAEFAVMFYGVAWVFGWVFSFFAFVLLISFAVIGFGMAVAAHSPPGNLVVSLVIEAIAWGGMVLMAFPSLWAPVRLSMFGPQVVDRVEDPIWGSWRASRGNFWALFFVAVCVWAIAYGWARLYSLAAAQGPWLSFKLALTPQFLAGFVFLAVSSGVAIAVVAAPWARAYRILSGPEPASVFE